MRVRNISEEDVEGFIDCYVEIWKSLEGVLPDVYVHDQVERASGAVFRDNLLAKMSDPARIILAAIVEKEIVGLAWGDTREDESSWLSFLGVSPCHRREGAGKALLARFIEESKGRGSRKISLNTDPRLVPAIKLYLDTGFLPDGVTTNQYGFELIVYSKVIA
jgi:ribosomal protein S18 acetylase RimI-like enzyme